MLQRHFRAYVLGNVYLMISWDLLGIELRQIADLKRALCLLVNVYFLPSKLYGSSKARFLAKNQL